MITHILGFLTAAQAFAQNNQFFAGLAGAGLIGGALMWLRSIPKRLWKGVVWLTSIQVEVSNDTIAFNYLLRWMTLHGDRWHIRTLKVGEADEYPSIRSADREDDVVAPALGLSPGRGSTVVWFRRWPYFIKRQVTNEGGTNGSRVREVIYIRTPGLTRKRVAALMQALAASVDTRRTLNTYVYHNGWNWFDQRVPRPISSIVPASTIDALADDLEKFLGRSQWYADHGVPYRRGYLLSGPPGTGKSSAAMALAGAFNLPIYILNLGSILTDTTLIDAITNVPPRAMLLIEDIDAASSSVRLRQDTGAKKESIGITLSGLLNCFDGAMAKEGRVLVMTTNYPERLDPALTRSGRIDVDAIFSLPGSEAAAQLFERFFPDQTLFTLAVRQHYKGGLSQADIQAVCLSHMNDPAGACRLISDGKKERA